MQYYEGRRPSLPSGQSGVPRKGRLTAIAADIHEVVRRTAPRAKGVPAELYPAWDAVVGAQVARVTRLDALHSGVLTVVVKNSVWIQELIMLRERIVGGLTDRLGEPLVHDVRFRVGRIHERKTPGHEMAPPPGPSRPLTDSARAKLEEVRDPELRAAIARALARTRE